VAERKDVLAACFGSLRWAYAKKRPAWVAAFFMLGIMSKPTVVTLPFALLLLMWPLGESIYGDPTGWNRPGGAAEKVPLLALVAVASVSRFRPEHDGRHGFAAGAPVLVRVNNACCRIAVLGKFFGQATSVLYPTSVFTMGSMVLRGAAGGQLRTIRLARRPLLAFGWFWFLGVLVPAIGLAQVGVQSFADRFTYLPLIGLFAAVVWGVSDLLGRAPRVKVALRGTRRGAGGALVAPNGVVEE